MVDNKMRVNIGIIVLIFTIILAILFVVWVMGPLSYEKAMMLENKGHQFTKDGNYKKAYIHFKKSAEIKNEKPEDISRRYRCAGTVSSTYEKGFEMYSLSLQYNPDNTNARKGLINLFNDKKKAEARNSIFKSINDSEKNNLVYDEGILYINKSGIWSIGKKGFAAIYLNKSQNIDIEYYTCNPRKKNYIVKISSNNKDIIKNNILPRIRCSSKLKLEKGINILCVEIDDSFIPKEFGINNDMRNLGISYKIKKLKKELFKYEYYKRYSDGWSEGKSGGIKVLNENNNENIVIKYFSSKPEKKDQEVEILLDGRKYESKIIKSGKIYSSEIKLGKGEHDVELRISETFNPKNLGMSNDDRELGINFKIKEDVVNEQS